MIPSSISSHLGFPQSTPSMAVDQNSIPKDLRPLNPIPLPADPLLFYPASADYTAPPPSWAYHHPAADEGPDDQPSSLLKVKFLCSFGGRILPRPSDGALRYAGGQTRIIAVRRDATLQGLMRKMEEACGCPVAIRYQLPDVDLDALVSVSSSEDLENMMEEYEKLAEASPDGSAKLRVFLFPPSDLATDPSSTLAHNASGLSDTGQRLYVDSVNGICSSEGSLRRSAASSTQNSDGPLIGPDAFADGTNQGVLNPVAFSDAPMSANPLAVGSAVPAQTLNPSRLELPPFSSQQAYVETNQVQYMNPKTLGMSAGSVPINVVGIPPHSYVQISTAPVISQVDNVNPIEPKVDTYLEENPYGGRVAQHHSDQNYKAFQPLSQLPSLPPSYLQPQNVERYGLLQVPPPPQGQVFRLEECHMCHKALPHTHSDPVIQDHGNVMGGGVPELRRVLHSHISEDATRVQAVQRMVPKAESTVSAVHFGAFGIAQIPETHRDNERLVLTNAQSFDQGSVLCPCPTGVVGLSGDTQVSHGMFVNLPQSHLDDSLQQLPQTLGGLSQFPAKQNAIAKPYINDVYPVKNGNIPAVEPLSRDSVLDSSYDYIRPIEGMMEVLHVNPFETSEFNGNWKPIVAPDLGVSKESIPENPLLAPVKPQVGGGTMSVGNPFTNPGVILGGNCVAPIHQLQSSSLGFTQLHNIQPSFPAQVATSGRYHFNQETRVEHMIPNERLHGTPAYSCTIDNAYNNRISTGDLKDEASLLHPDVLNDTAAPPGGNVSIPLSNSGGITGHVEQFQEPLLSGSLFCNLDPRIVMGSTHLLPPRPSWVAGKEPVIPKDLSTENCLVNSKGSGMSVLLEEGGFRQPLNSLNKDSCSELGVRATKDSAEEQIKLELQALAEGVAASVLESNVPPEPVFFARETMESAPQCNKERGVIEDGYSLQSAVALGDPRIEDIKTKQLDKMILNFPITDDFGRLQIIKNSDLEELQELGSGTFGTVYHGKWKGSDVAIKRMNDRCFAGKPSDQERMMTDFWNEACKLADLHHPNVVAFYGLVLDGPAGSVATVTEYMVNGSLRHVLLKNDNRTLDHCKRMLIAMDVAFGMEYLHDKNIVHFDLKSDNLLVNLRDPQRPICKVGDLGLSKVKCQTLISGSVRGTLPWMAPELLNGSSGMVSEKVDVFSFGIVMWELLTGEEPYADLHYGAIIGGIVNNTLRPPVPDSCDPDWRSLMERCWSSEPSERPNFTEIANKLRAIAASLPSKGRPQEQTLVQPQR